MLILINHSLLHSYYSKIAIMYLLFTMQKLSKNSTIEVAHYFRPFSIELSYKRLSILIILL
jgi:hypothetical protein